MSKSDALAIVPRHAPLRAEVQDLPDERLVNRAVGYIRGVITKTVERGLDEIGQYLLKEFYADDPEAYLSHRSIKNASLSLLVQKCGSIELPVSRSFLADALRVAAISHSLPRSSAYRSLPLSHRVALSRVEDPSQRERLAGKAQAGKLSVASLRPLIAKEVTHERAKRPRSPGIPPLLRVLEQVTAALRDEETGRLRFKRSEVQTMSVAHRERVEAAYARLLPRLRDLEKLIVG